MLQSIQPGLIGARLARREKGEWSRYSTDVQGSPPG